VPSFSARARGSTTRTVPGHSLPLAALGVFILWLGWFGFNAGSTTAGTTDIALIALNTFVAAGAGAAAAMATTWIRGGTPDATMTLNGVLGGLVGITAGCANLLPGAAILTGAVAGVIVVFATDALERIIDDPVGAVAVHGVCGAWGTLAAGLFATSGFSLSQVGVQLIGIAAAFAWTFPVSYAVFSLADAALGLRIEDDLEDRGLDLHEHDVHAYPEFLPGAVEGRVDGNGSDTSKRPVVTVRSVESTA
jgi:Amt family ammonium transporter